MNENDWDVIVIGGGAAGLSAALMLGRARRRVLVLDAGSPRNRFASHMHGMLGNEGTPPQEFLARGRSEVASYGVEVREATVSSVADSPAGLVVITEAGQSLTARRLIVATGVTDVLPPIPGLAERWGKDVLHCPYCHGWEVRDQRFAVIAATPHAAHQAQLVRQWSDRVTLFTRGLIELDDQTRRTFASRDVVVDGREVTEVVVENDALVGLRVGGGEIVPVDAIFTGGILKPHDDFLAALDLEREESPFGSVIKVDPTGRTSDAQIWAVGNVVSPPATVPMVIAMGAMAGGAANMDLVSDDFAVAGQ
jgi:thioredoxin reductase